VLSALQLRVAALVASLPEAEGFALAGGAALIARGDVDRLTRDLDFFGLSAEAVDRLLPVAENALVAEGLSVERVQVGSGFARLIVFSGEDRTELDLAADARLFPVEVREPAPLLSREELAIDKLLAVFGRAEARRLHRPDAAGTGLRARASLSLAATKDTGFDMGVFAGMLGRFGRLRRDEFGLDDTSYGALSSAVGRWRQQAEALSNGG
jgi:Nucleotidyl transferase AbiEii toxin, Type IV TA system